MELEVPFSAELVRAFWLAAGGSILAADLALPKEVAINIGGGFHHAFPDHGEGFCMIHDVAVAIRRMQREGKIHTAMTVDCDVHHGNGTAAIFAGTRAASEPLPSVPSAIAPIAPQDQTAPGNAMTAPQSPETFSRSRFIRKIIIRRSSLLLRSTSICLTESATTIISPGSTMR